MVDLQIAIGRNHVDMSGQNDRAVGDLLHWELTHALQQFREQRAVRRVEVLHHDERESASDRDGAEKLLERLESTGGSANGDDRERGRRGVCRAPHVRLLIAGHVPSR